VIVHRKVGSLRDAGAFDAWLYRIVMHESARVRRRHEPIGQRLFESFIENESATTLDVWRALAALPPALRDVTVLFYFDDLKSNEIAAILGIAHATVRTRLARAREHLHGLLEDYGDEPRPAPREIQQHGL
jgi:RNA polymerase sigma-70 factor (ECF subfamily)